MSYSARKGIIRCFIPKQWDVYERAALECVLYPSLYEHWKTYKTVLGTSVTIEDVTARVKFYRIYIWMCQDGDSSRAPDADKYTLMHIALY